MHAEHLDFPEQSSSYNFRLLQWNIVVVALIHFEFAQKGLLQTENTVADLRF